MGKRQKEILLLVSCVYDVAGVAEVSIEIPHVEVLFCRVKPVSIRMKSAKLRLRFLNVRSVLGARGVCCYCLWLSMWCAWFSVALMTLKTTLTHAPYTNTHTRASYKILVESTKSLCRAPLPYSTPPLASRTPIAFEIFKFPCHTKASAKVSK